jgi:hypothetical protein
MIQMMLHEFFDKRTTIVAAVVASVVAIALYVAKLEEDKNIDWNQVDTHERARWQKMTEAEAEAECWKMEALVSKDNRAVVGWPNGWYAHECLVKSAIEAKTDLSEATKERWRGQYQATSTIVQRSITAEVCAYLRREGLTPEQDRIQRQVLENDLADATGRKRGVALKANCEN